MFWVFCLKMRNVSKNLIKHLMDMGEGNIFVTLMD